MLQTLLLAITMLLDSESRAHAHALVATSAATGAAGSGRLSKRSAPERAVPSRHAALEAASPEAKRYTTRDTVLIGASVTALFAVILLIVLL